MTPIAHLSFHFDLDFYEIPLDEAEEYLQILTSKYANLIFNQKTSVEIHLTEGSLKARIYILGALYIGIGQYGSFRSGIDYLINDAKSLKGLITSEIVKDGMRQEDIIGSKRLQCSPDRIRRVLLAIDRLESNKESLKFDFKKEISKIRTSVKNICQSLSNEDAGFFAVSINKKYWPDDSRIPYYIERYKLVAREEDILQHPASKIDAPAFTKTLLIKSSKEAPFFDS